MSRTIQKSCRPRVSDRIMVGTLADTIECLRSFRSRTRRHHRVMKPSSRNHHLGWSHYRGSQDQNPSRFEAGLDASDNIHVPTEGKERIFFLTSPFIGLLTSPSCTHNPKVGGSNPPPATNEIIRLRAIWHL